MDTSLLEYDLPGDLIAQHPAERRSDSRMLVLDRAGGGPADRRFADLGEYLRAGDCLVLNDTKVIPARFYAARRSGAVLEGLFLGEVRADPSLRFAKECYPLGAKDEGRGAKDTRPNTDNEMETLQAKAASTNAIRSTQYEIRDTKCGWRVYLKGLRKLRGGEEFDLLDRCGRAFCAARLVEVHAEGQCTIAADSGLAALEVLARIGYPPLPPYIKRDVPVRRLSQDAGEAPAIREGNPGAARRNSTHTGRMPVLRAADDLLRYQTVYADKPGAVAAPTAGLHFTVDMLDALRAGGIRLARVTLHVGPGTFKPVTESTLENHRIHSETFVLDAENAAIINETREHGGRIIAVGTTSTRTLETAADEHGRVQPAAGQTRLFITPGYPFKAVDALITNFHLPRSTLLALVAAFAGLDPVLKAYRHAIAQRYRFYSYGDAMLIL